MQDRLIGFLTFLLIFGVLVIVHELGHFYFAKKNGILVREFAVGMGPKIFAHIGKDGTAYTIRILPLGGYVRMAGWGIDTTEIKTGQAASLTLNEAGLVTRVNLSNRHQDPTALPINITAFDFEDKLEVTGLVLNETKTYQVDHDAMIVEEDGTEVRIAPLDVQYQNASVWGRMMVNFAGPMNNFILGTLACILLVFMQGGVADLNTNKVTVVDGGAAQVAGLQTGDAIVQIEGKAIKTWDDISQAVNEKTKGKSGKVTLSVTYERDGQTKTIELSPKKTGDYYLIGVQNSLKTGFWDKLKGGFDSAGDSFMFVFNALKRLITKPSLDEVGGPVAIFEVSAKAAKHGLESVIYVLAVLSINLGVVNLLPIPVLDGGKILLNIIEAIRRKPLKKETEGAVTMVGVAIMVILMIVVTWNDIMRAFF